MRKGWLQADKCGAYVGDRVCGRTSTHAVFLNTPWDRPYIVGSCSAHRKSQSRFPFITMRRLTKTIEKLVSEGISPHRMPFAIAKALDPALKVKGKK